MSSWSNRSPDSIGPQGMQGSQGPPGPIGPSQTAGNFSQCVYKNTRTDGTAAVDAILTVVVEEESVSRNA